jgi:hypothetical protein
VTCGSQIRGYVVEWSADCNGDGITDYGQILQGTLPDANGNGVPDACDQAQEPQGFLRFERPTDTARIFGNTEFPSVDFTYEMRIRVDPGSPLGRVISEQRDTYEDKSVWISGSTFYGYMTRNRNCGNVNESAVSGIAGAWHHVAWTRDASVARLFVDGQPVATWPSQYVCTGNSPDSLMAIGMIRYAYGCAEQASFRGDLDWIRVSRTCRYSAPFLPPTECNAAADADISQTLATKLPASVQVIHVWNKCDVRRQWAAPNDAQGIALSAKTGEGLATLRQQLLQVAGWQQASEGLYIARARHVHALREVHTHVDMAQALLQAQAQSLDLLAEELRLAQNALNAITGEFTSDDLLGVIFSSFCIGK